MLGKNFEEFTKKIVTAEKNALNGEAGQAMTKELLKIKLAENPKMTTEEWEKCKHDFMLFLFFHFVGADENLKNELGTHVWEELRK